MMSLDWTQWVQVIAGSLLGLAGLWTLAFRRRWWQALGLAKRRDDGEAGGGGALPIAPTRLVIGVILFLAGYHVVVWALPPAIGSRTPLQLDRAYWWLWALCALGAVGLSVVIDRLEQRWNSGE